MADAILRDLVVDVNLVDWRGFKALPNNLPQSLPGIYAVVNLLNFKLYVGESKNLASRLANYSKGHVSQRKFRNALDKHGKKNFVVIPLYYLSIFDKDHILAVETSYILEYDAISSGYNVLENYHGGPYSELFKDGLLAAWQRPETRAAHEAAKSETIEKQRATMLAKFEDPDVRAKHIANINTPEAKANLSASLTAYYADESNREKARQAQAAVADVHAASLRAAHARNPRGWITTGKTHRYHFFNDPIPEGYVRGRKGTKEPKGVVEHAP